MLNVKWVVAGSFLLLWFGTGSVLAEIYKWVDADGQTQFSDVPPAGADTETVELNINTYEAVEITQQSAPIERKERPQRVNKKVVMYVTQRCGYCAKAKQYFNQKHIPYVAYDVEKSAIGKKAFKDLGGRGVPIILVGKQRMNGFSPEQFDQMYAQETQATSSRKPE